MKTKVLLIGLFLLTFVTGIYLIPKTQKEITTKNVQPKIAAPKISEQTVSTAANNENVDVISYETAKNFGGAEMLDENYWEQEIKYRYDLLYAGQFHGDEITAKSGEKWLGLFKQNDQFYLSTTEINVERVHDIIVDEKKNQKTGKKVSVNNKNEPLFLINNAAKLKIGKVKTHFGVANLNEVDENNRSKNFNTESPYNFEFNNENYLIKVEKVFNDKGAIVYALILEMNQTKQILNVSQEDYLGSLNWIGDLDNDGKPDFFISPWIKENVSDESLYISSEAEKNNLVKKIATIVVVGC